jgi:hypothetical protein
MKRSTEIIIACVALFLAWLVYYQQELHKPTEKEIQANQACAVLQTSQQYQVSRPGGDYRRGVDEVCDSFRRNAVK